MFQPRARVGMVGQNVAMTSQFLFLFILFIPEHKFRLENHLNVIQLVKCISCVLGGPFLFPLCRNIATDYGHPTIQQEQVCL